MIFKPILHQNKKINIILSFKKSFNQISNQSYQSKQSNLYKRNQFKKIILTIILVIIKFNKKILKTIKLHNGEAKKYK